jgi:hypothetical protein
MIEIKKINGQQRVQADHRRRVIKSPGYQTAPAKIGLAGEPNPLERVLFNSPAKPRPECILSEVEGPVEGSSPGEHCCQASSD